MNTPANKKARLIAIYLPQFHPIPENNKWWGEGFTEWTRVSNAKPLFSGHYQPHIPADLGFYDLRLPESRQAQADLARVYGIEGFCYWHYWFCGKRLLERPFNEVLASGEPDFPFCLAWANEEWKRTWTNNAKIILAKQSYSPEDDLNHARWLVRVFADKRCIRVQGRPVFLIYRPLSLPEPRATLDIIRKECDRNGLPDPFLVGINSHCPDYDLRKSGFDGTMSFEPQLGSLPNILNMGLNYSKFRRNLKFGITSPKLRIYDYREARRSMKKSNRDFPVYPSIIVGWDNTARMNDKAVILINADAESFSSGLDEMVNSVLERPYDDRLVFINAWNEWAEGNHLEPDLKNGLKYLEAVKRVNTVAELEKE